MSKIETENEENFTENRIYEIGYLLAPTILEEDVAGRYGDLKEAVHIAGGNVISDDMPRMMPLAYEMIKTIANVNHKFDSAYFGWVKFEMDPEKVLELKRKLEADTGILRFLIIKTVRENTIATKRFASRDIFRQKPSEKKDAEQPAPEINKEEIDKEIEALVTE